jgi:hypothetical protein
MAGEKDAPKCICRACPSYVKCDEGIAYCFSGKSACIKKEKGCLCPGCPVQSKAGFSKVFYCTRGSNKEQSGK